MSKLTNIDITNALKYLNEFDIKNSVDPKIVSGLEKYRNTHEFTNEQTEEIKVLICQMMFTDHPTFNDGLWDKPKEEATKLLQEKGVIDEPKSN